jgi:very-short-patch-repair endonuclease
MVDELGGLARKRQLVRRGARDRHLTEAVRLREVVRVRNGWYTTRPPQDAAVRAVRVGGRLTGLVAIADAGGWVHRPPRLQVAVRRNSARLRSPVDRRRRRGPDDPVRVHWDADPRAGTLTRVSIAQALRRAILDEPLEDAVAAVDWAFSAGELDRVGWEQLVLSLPRRCRGIRFMVDARCGSLPESLARTRLRMAGLRVRSQVPVAHFGAIDLVVENAVAIEVDGDRFHRDRFARDRAKDLDIALTGLHPLRPSADIVFRRWRELEDAVLIMLLNLGVAVPPRAGPSRATPARG